MEGITQNEKILLLGGLDLTVNTLSHQLNSSTEEKARTILRSKISESIVLASKIEKIKTKD
jgi:hypothetical protein